MPLNIKDPEADRLARALAERTGESITDAVTQALRGRLRREEGRAAEPDLAEELMEIGRRCAGLPVLDDRSPDEIVGYDEHGVPR